MQKNTPSKTTFIALAVIVAIALGLFFYFQGDPTDADSSLETLGTPESLEAQEAGTRVLSLLNKIRSLKIDDSIFKSAVYKSLVDYSITVPEQSVGRANPFAPLSGH
ncbi:MAG: hypothetical protein Q7S72_01555 [Candidatus Taylorbacteria bacterium]|nr:hypothetical protein [Candidatus Taylorbacteria bacterium]